MIDTNYYIDREDRIIEVKLTASRKADMQTLEGNHPSSQVSLEARQRLLQQGIKRCPKCGLALTTSSFTTRVDKSDGLAVHCKNCRSVESLLYPVDPEVAKVRRRAWQKSNRDKVNAANARYYNANKAEILARRKLARSQRMDIEDLKVALLAAKT